MNNIMKLADACEIAATNRHQWGLETDGEDRIVTGVLYRSAEAAYVTARAKLEAAVEQQAKEIERLTLRESVPEDVFARGLINEEVTALCNAAVTAIDKQREAQGAVAKAVVLTTGIGLQWIGEALPAGTKLFTHALPAQPAEPAKDAGLVADGCVWTQDSDFEMGDTYDSGCGEKWSFIDGGPAENNVRFCQGCGKPVVIASAQPQQKEG